MKVFLTKNLNFVKKTMSAINEISNELAKVLSGYLRATIFPKVVDYYRTHNPDTVQVDDLMRAMNFPVDKNLISAPVVGQRNVAMPSFGSMPTFAGTGVTPSMPKAATGGGGGRSRIKEGPHGACVCLYRFPRGSQGGKTAKPRSKGDQCDNPRHCDEYFCTSHKPKATSSGNATSDKLQQFYSYLGIDPLTTNVAPDWVYFEEFQKGNTQNVQQALASINNYSGSAAQGVQLNAYPASTQPSLLPASILAINPFDPKQVDFIKHTINGETLFTVKPVNVSFPEITNVIFKVIPESDSVEVLGKLIQQDGEDKIDPNINDVQLEYITFVAPKGFNINTDYVTIASSASSPSNQQQQQFNFGEAKEQSGVFEDNWLRDQPPAVNDFAPPAEETTFNLSGDENDVDIDAFANIPTTMGDEISASNNEESKRDDFDINDPSASNFDLGDTANDIDF